jgi:glycosyltransferase involved in cell wall biosynthesis
MCSAGVPERSERLRNGLPTIYAMSGTYWYSKFWVDRHHLLSRLAARGWPVVYSRGALSIWDRHSGLWRNAPWLSRFDRVEFKPPNAVLVERAGRLLPRWPTVAAWDNLAVRFHAHRLLRADPAAANRDGIAFLCYPDFLPYADALGARYVVLHVNDAWNLMPGWSEREARMLAELVERADLITAVAESIARHLPGIGARKARIIPHGVDNAAVAAGAAAPCPGDLARVPHPRIGYVGRISSKVDLPLVAEVAAARPQWHWVFVGEVGIGGTGAFEGDAAAAAAFATCTRLDNVHFLGGKPYPEVAAYVNHMDVNTMCYRAGQPGFWTAGNPLKLHEYLATGKPVIGAALENIRPFASVIDIAGTTTEWIAAIDRALEAGGVGTPSERRAVAAQHDWEQRTDLLEGWLLEMMTEEK